MDFHHQRLGVNMVYSHGLQYLSKMGTFGEILQLQGKSSPETGEFPDKFPLFQDLQVKPQCACTNTHTALYLYIYISIYLYLYLCTYVRMYVRTYVCMHVCMYVCAVMICNVM